MIIKNVKIVNHNHTINNANIEIKNGLINKIIKLPGEGKKIVIPGFIDPHIHGFFNHDCMDGTKGVKEVAKALAKIGVTSFFPTLMTGPWNDIIKALKDIAALKETKGAKIKGIHLEGPFIALAKKGAHNERFITKATESKIKELKKASNNLLTRITLAPEVVDLALIKMISNQGIVVSLGHTNASASLIDQAQKAGATSATHLWNGMSGVANRTPGATQGILQNEQIYAEIIGDLIHVDPNTISFSIKNKSVNKIILVSDAIRPAGMIDGFYQSGNLAVQKLNNEIRLVSNNSIAGAARGLDFAFSNLLKLGYSLADLVKMTSYNISVNQHLTKVGQIKVNYEADLLILNQKYQIEKVYLQGKKIINS